MNAVHSYVSSAVDNSVWVTEGYNFHNVNIPAFLHSLYYHAFRERERDTKFVNPRILKRISLIHESQT
jgi:hypothetical protein